MKCPKCGVEIDHVYVSSYCNQTASLDGNQTIDYFDLEVGETLIIYCPECDADIKEFIEEI